MLRPHEIARQPALLMVLILAVLTACQREQSPRPAVTQASPSITRPLSTKASLQLTQLVEAAIEQTKVTTGYDPAYVGIAYPGHL